MTYPGRAFWMTWACKNYLYNARMFDFLNCTWDSEPGREYIAEMDKYWPLMTRDEQQMVEKAKMTPVKPVPDAIDDEERSYQPRENFVRVRSTDGCELVEDEE